MYHIILQDVLAVIDEEGWIVIGEGGKIFFNGRRGKLAHEILDEIKWCVVTGIKSALGFLRIDIDEDDKKIRGDMI